MIDLQKKVLDIIYSQFSLWAGSEKFCCSKCCSVCCSRNVTMTSLEGAIIHQFFIENHRQHLLEDILNNTKSVTGPYQTTNAYVDACFQETDIEQNEECSTEKCPFLHNDMCTIYAVRPFSCRCFASTQLCRNFGSALVPDHYLSGSMVVMQIIEHLDQLNHWGNMLDILLAQSNSSTLPHSPLHIENEDLVYHAQNRLLKARPIPGFVISEEDMVHIASLLRAIFEAEIEGKSIEQILNGK